MSFNQLEIIQPILSSIQQEGYTVPSPIQEQAIPLLLSKKDIMGSAQTGTGKTAAFAIPILQNITLSNHSKGIKALILTPTRELAMQIKESFDTYGRHLPLKTVVIYGGVKQKTQTQKLKRGADILVATPGRLLDLIHQKHIDLSHTQYFVLDEADRMLDMGFIKDVKKIISFVPKERQTMLFSATLPKSILNLAHSILLDPIKVQIAPEETTLETIQQTVCQVKPSDKINLLLHILNDKEKTSILIFSRTKRFANKITKQLKDYNVSVLAIHGNKSQFARTQALAQFKQNKVRVLVATDVASRGIDIDELSLVINYNLPEVPETYIHRIGRTGRANNIGMAISLVSEDEYGLLKDIQNHIKMQIYVDKDQPYHIDITPSASNNKPRKSNNNRNKKKNTNKHTKRKYVPKDNNNRGYKKNFSNKSERIL